MESANQSIENYFLTEKPYFSILVIVVTALLCALIKKAMKVQSQKLAENGQKLTAIRIITNILKYIIISAAVLTVMSINGINITSIAAGLGISSIVVGFALQDALKDIAMGSTIMWNSFFVVGDAIKYNDKRCIVTGFTVKCTKLRDIDTGSIYSVSNRNITEIEKLSDWLFINCPAPYEVTLGKMKEVLAEVCARAEKNENIRSISNLGTKEFGPSEIVYLLKITCDPSKTGMVSRAVNEIIQQVYDENGIEIPYHKLDVHMI